jgi:serine/threonine protein kinase
MEANSSPNEATPSPNLRRRGEPWALGTVLGYASASIFDRLGVETADPLIGPAAYMSPEQVRGEVLDARTDIFSFGAALDEAATGRKAFPGETAEEVQQAILTHQPAWAKTLNPDLPAKLEEIIHRALEKTGSCVISTLPTCAPSCSA